jgi:KDO2-lipid IV(A) lauroyltransferase
VVREQLSFAFPEKSAWEKKEIEKKFYRHFCDILVEVLYMQRISEQEICARCVFTDRATKIFREFENKNIPFVAVLGHCGNWEWVNLAFSARFKIPLLGIYHPLHNTYWNQWMLKNRSRFGGIMVPMHRVFRFVSNVNYSCFGIGLIADQSAPPEHSYCIEFMNRKTTVFKGPEKIAGKFDFPVLYIPVYKSGRGKYIIDAKIVSEKPQKESEGVITLKHVSELEENIRKQPEIWLWTHRRWKHRCE